MFGTRMSSVFLSAVYRMETVLQAYRSLEEGELAAYVSVVLQIQRGRKVSHEDHR